MAFVLSNKQMELLDQSLVANLATVNKKGVPFVKPVWVVFQDGKIYFTTKVDDHKYRHIQQNKNIGMSIVHPKGSIYLSLLGKANIITKLDYSEYDFVIERIIRKYVSDFDKANEIIEKAQNDDERVLVEIIPKDVI